MTKKLVSILIILITLSSLTACGSTKGKDAQIIFPIDNDPLFLDPQIISDVGAKNIILNCFEGLLTLGENGELLPGMAESYTVSSNGLTYTFNLRSDSRWKVSSAAKRVIGEDVQLYPTYNERGKLQEIEEGKEIFNITVTAHDFAFALKRALLPETKCPTAYKLYCIKNAEKVNEGTLSADKLGIKALNDTTLEITLQKSDPDFLYTLLDPACMPCNEEFFEKTGGRYGLATRYLIYNGPFYINNWADNSSVSIRKNSDYYYDSENVMPYSVYFSINNEQDTRLRKLKNDTYDISPFTKNQAEEVNGKRNYTINIFSASTTALLFNCDDDFLKNINIRRAISSSLDISVIEAEKGKLTAKGVFPRSLLVGSTPYSESKKSVTRYKTDSPQTLFKYGLEELEQNTAEIVILCKTEDETLVRKLIQSWQTTLGIIFNVSVEAVDEYTLQKRINEGEYQLALSKITFSGNSAFDAAFKFTSGSRDNPLNYSSSGYDGTVKKIALTSNQNEKAAVLLKSEQYLINSSVIVPLYEENSYQVFGKGISKVTFNKTGDVLYFKNTLEE